MQKKECDSVRCMIVGVGGTHAAGVGNVVEKSAVFVMVVLGEP